MKKLKFNELKKFSGGDISPEACAAMALAGYGAAMGGLFAISLFAGAVFLAAGCSDII